MVGLDAAGKTTILYKLKLGEIVTTIPTIGKKITLSKSLFMTASCKFKTFVNDMSFYYGSVCLLHLFLYDILFHITSLQ